MTSEHQIELILTMVFLSIVVLFAVLALGGTLLVLIRENKKLQSAGDLAQRINAYHSALVNLRKEHIALDELVSSWMNRQATRGKRARKAEREDEEASIEQPNETVFFPSVNPNE